MKNILIKAENVCKKADEITILDNVNLNVFEGDFTVIMGASGAGKSTLLYDVSGMDKITSGKVFLEREEISSFSEKRLTSILADSFGFVFQQINLVSNLTLRENILATGYAGKKYSKENVRKRAEELILQVKTQMC